MFWIYIPAIYFFIGPCMALVLNLAPSNMRSIFTAWSVLVGNVFNLIVAPQAVGIMSDWFARGHGADAASLRLALLVLAPTGFWAVWHFCVGRKDRRRGPEARHRLRGGVRRSIRAWNRRESSVKQFLLGSILPWAALATLMPAVSRSSMPMRTFPKDPSGITASCITWSMTAIR